MDDNGIPIMDQLRAAATINKKHAEKVDKPGYDVLPNDGSFDNMGFFHSTIDNSVQGINGANRPRGKTPGSEDGSMKAAVPSNMAIQVNENNERVRERLRREYAAAQRPSPKVALPGGVQHLQDGRAAPGQQSGIVTPPVDSTTPPVPPIAPTAPPTPAKAPEWKPGK